jgi:type I restriction enzyme, R subunit
VQFLDEHFNEKMVRAAEEADLDENEEDRFEREFSKEYNIITRDDRLNTIAEHIVSHFMGRGYLGKAMVVSIDKITALRMYNKVQHYWYIYREELQKQLDACDATDPAQEKKHAELINKLQYMQETKMALVVSSEQNEVEKFRKHDLDIEPHRRFMKEHNLEEMFKDSKNPLRIVFVCAMWMTGFDVPSLSTIYLDKPLRKALAIYALDRKKGETSETATDALPIQNKSRLLTDLKRAITEIERFCQEQSIDIQAILAIQKRAAAGFDLIHQIQTAADN